MKQIVETDEYYNRQVITQNRIAAAILFLSQVAMVFLYGFFVISVPNKPVLNTPDHGLIVASSITLLAIPAFSLTLMPANNRIWTSVAFSLLIVAISVPLHSLMTAFWHMVNVSSEGSSISWGNRMDLYLSNQYMLNSNTLSITITDGLKCALANIVAFSSISGRCGLLGVVVLTLISSVIYQLNRQLVLKYSFDLGGSIIIFCYGGFFGTAVSTLLYYFRQKNIVEDHPLRRAGKFNFSLKGLGALLCFIFFPWLAMDVPLQTAFSFHSGVNMLVGISACVMATTTIECMIEGRLDFRTIVLSPLAGGVVISTSAAICNSICGTILIGMGTAIALTLLIRVPRSLKNILYTDNNAFLLFGLMGLAGGLISTIFVQIQRDNPIFKLIHYGTLTSFSKTALSLLQLPNAADQLRGVGVCVGIATGGGVIVGLLLSLWSAQERDDLYHDQANWLLEVDDLSALQKKDVDETEQWQQQSKPQTQVYKQMMVKETYHLKHKHTVL